jgi:hypothetical protein
VKKYIHLTFILDTKYRVITFGINCDNQHSEDVAMKKLNNIKISPSTKRKGFYIYNSAVSRSGNIRISKPCLICCRRLIKSKYRLRGIVWTTQTGLDSGSIIDVEKYACRSTGYRPR